MANRFFRRMLRFGKNPSPQQDRDQFASREQSVVDARTPQDVTSPRAKSQRHGKSTADKWNQ
jgi:hypothetical protein